MENLENIDQMDITIEQMIEIQEHKRQLRYAQNKRYYQKNKDKVINHCLEKVPCENCQELVSRNYMARHRRTQKCAQIAKLKDYAKA